ncbi:dipicolinate synthase subunit DpsA [Jeotgalibacillus aurantiacus]|uniref:dipicolinate synthase subunit DpsA n=1 Tax=Jeotgalibacillus aurantiacus TaxID=2763266 RepID=UPI001D0A8F51|nr:dipicolinate synthase subunit DpsA [Jeotgalibacillus aurantiacus]
MADEKHGSVINIAVIGGDARQKIIAQTLCQKGFHLYLAGFDLLALSEPGYTKCTLDELPLHMLDAMIFPVSGVMSNGEVRSSFSKHNIILSDENMERVKRDCLLFSGIRTEWLEKQQHETVYMMEEDEVAILNSIPTAEGVLWLLIQHTEKTIHQSRILISGFGRTGMTIARMLKALGAHVYGTSISKAENARMVEMGIEVIPFPLCRHHLSHIETWINTIPSDGILTMDTLSWLEPKSTIIELASNPCPEQKKNAEMLGLNYIEAPSLPGMVAPKTAGTILADAITGKLKTDGV